MIEHPDHIASAINHLSMAMMYDTLDHKRATINELTLALKHVDELCSKRISTTFEDRRDAIRFAISNLAHADYYGVNNTWHDMLCAEAKDYIERAITLLGE